MGIKPTASLKKMPSKVRTFMRHILKEMTFKTIIAGKPTRCRVKGGRIRIPSFKFINCYHEKKHKSKFGGIVSILFIICPTLREIYPLPPGLTIEIKSFTIFFISILG